jgi:hypothetical protein
LGEQGLAAFVVPEAEALAAAHPQLVPGGRLEQGALHVLVDDHEENVQPTDLLLIVRGDIVREYQTRDKTRRVSAATLETGHRIHLHRRAGGSPLELDPGNFEFLTTDGPATSSLLRLAGWVEAVRGAAPLDLDFRWLAPALGPASAPAGRLGAVEALRGQPRAASAPLVLDNLRQFRLYSGWRACVERRRARREA